jgi:predicted Rossmann fold flavoprotein
VIITRALEAALEALDLDARWDVLIVGAGAAGLATAIFTRERNPNRSVLLLDGARKPGAKILVSGGARCNVTNTIVTERDFRGGPPAIVRRILRRFSARDAVDFFARAGVTLHEEDDGKLFPDSNRSRDVLDALLRVASDAGVVLRSSQRVISVRTNADRFIAKTTSGEIAATRVVLATGGLSLPKTGSDGLGHAIARGLGHSIVPTTPALAPLLLEPGELHAAISGVSLDVELTLWVDGSTALRLRGPMLWTHFGISGPAALDVSRHWLRARLEQRTVALTASFVPGLDFNAMERHWIEARGTRPRSSLGTSLGSLIPESMAAALLERLQIDPATQLANLERDNRRRVTRALTEWPLTISDSRGYNYAEVTAGGVDLREIDASTMESRLCPGLFLVGEILDVDGRLGGFNFQWAWSSAYVAAAAIADA